tara:strand:- start:1904 stop:2440 length:537 start_codon:yes stop_codon:yes gene_type:complete
MVPVSAEATPSNIEALYGNTVEIKIEFAHNGTRFYPVITRYYFTKDGNYVLTAWGKRDTDRDDEFRGVTFGREKKLCVEPPPGDDGMSMVLCGTMKVRDTVITLIKERRSWNTAISYAYNDQLETVFSFNGDGECSFIWEESRAIDSDYVAIPGDSNFGSCSISQGRHLYGREMVIPK